MKYKYPSTPHLPWSEEISRDDKRLSNVEHFKGLEVVVTEKMDGENTTFAQDYLHARSLDGNNHPSMNWVKNFWAQRKHLINPTIRICGENVYAKHSIYYENLPSYFLGFSVWTGNYCFNWDTSLGWFEELDIVTVPVLYRGVFDEELIKGLYKPGMEGYVVRCTDGFAMNEFGLCMAKFVRKGHVQTDEHWKYQQVIPNKLKS